MKCNVGRVDKLIRIVIAFVAVAIAKVYSVWWIYIIAVIMLITAIIGFCPIYSGLKLNTCK